MAAMIQTLQARVEALEERSRRDRAEAQAARAELRAMRRARGAAVTSAEPTRVVVSKSSEAVLAPATVAPEPVNGFAGPYAAFLAGYGFGPDAKPAPQPFGVPGTLSQNTSRLSALSDARVGAALGYNRTFGDLLIGAEGRVRAAFGQTTATVSSTAPSRPLPFVFATSCCGPNAAVPTSFGNFALSQNVISSAVLNRIVSGDAAVRAGLIWDDWLFYGRFGAGADVLRSVTTRDNRGTVTCVDPTVSVATTPGGARSSSVVGCGVVSTGQVIKLSDALVSPYAVVGLGIERNFGPVFARVEGNLYINLPPSLVAQTTSSTSYTTEIMGAVGYRF
ncbi:hypothetical protein [Methylobacterium nodulans]|nr:hypothetical protein [Methylobacterium nodulans]